MKPSESNIFIPVSGIDDAAAATAAIPAPAGGATTPERVANDAELRRIMTQVMARRARGEVLSDHRVLAEHPHLHAQLAEELEGLRMLRQAFLAAQRAGPLTGEINPIDPDQLESPIGPPTEEESSPTPWDELERPLQMQGYQILCEISRGGQATVFKAIQEVTGRRVAVKVLPGGPLAGARHRARFEREAQALASLDHPNVVGILDRGRTPDGSFFLVMQFIDGCALDEYAAEAQLADADFPVGLLRIFVKIADAVHEAHRLGIVHRDLKPPNIRVDNRGEPHLLDFGLARIRGSDDQPGPDSATVLTMAGQVVGSLPWASPEQAGGSSAQVDARSDVYSLGVCLYQCLTGRFPYPVAGSITEVVKHVTLTPPSPLKWTTVRFPRVGALESVLARALAKAPSRRYQTAHDFARDLEALLDGAPVAAGEGFFLPARRWVRPLLWGALACSVAGAAWTLKGPAPKKSSFPPVTLFPQPTQENTIGMRMVRLTGGTFRMGSTQEIAPDERDHEVRLSKRFWIGEREVTRGQYLRVMGHDALPDGVNAVSDDLPVTGVTWDEADEFCRKLSQMEGRRYRLPTEAEWEYACRAGAQGRFAGSGLPDRMGWHKNISGLQGLHLGGLKEYNEWGLYDFHGNAAEWCEDSYLASYPAQVKDPAFDEPGASRVIRGGSYAAAPDECRSSARDKLPPNQTRPDLGFRVVCEASQIATNPSR